MRFRRVHVVVRTVVEFDGNVDDRESRLDAAFHRLDDAFFHRLDVLLRNDTPFDVVDEFEMVFAVDVILYFLSGSTGSIGLMRIFT